MFILHMYGQLFPELQQEKVQLRVVTDLTFMFTVSSAQLAQLSSNFIGTLQNPKYSLFICLTEWFANNIQNVFLKLNSDKNIQDKQEVVQFEFKWARAHSLKAPLWPGDAPLFLNIILWNRTYVTRIQSKSKQGQAIQR